MLTIIISSAPLNYFAVLNRGGEIKGDKFLKF